MEQKKNTTEPGNSFPRFYWEIDAPIEERSICVSPGTFIKIDTLTFLCVESSIPPHCVGCDAPHELCQVMCCMPIDRRDRKYVLFKCVHDNE